MINIKRNIKIFKLIYISSIRPGYDINYKNRIFFMKHVKKKCNLFVLDNFMS